MHENYDTILGGHDVLHWAGDLRAAGLPKREWTS